MNRSRCECEQGVVDALRRGGWTAELRGHVESCTSCAETRRVAESMLRYAAALRVAPMPTSADQIWRRAQAQRQAMILKRATRPLIFMRALSFGCVLAFAAWLMHGISRLDLGGMMRGWGIGAGLAGASGEAAVGVLVSASVWAGIAVLCIALGAVYLLHEGRRVRVFDATS